MPDSTPNSPAPSLDNPAADANTGQPMDRALPSERAGLSAHILPTSATMIGVCMTVLTIGQLGSSGRMRWLTDKLLAIDALIFLCSAVLSFISLRSRRGRAMFEVRAEWVFIAALGLLALAAMILAFSIN